MLGRPRALCIVSVALAGCGSESATAFDGGLDAATAATIDAGVPVDAGERRDAGFDPEPCDPFEGPECGPGLRCGLVIEQTELGDAVGYFLGCIPTGRQLEGTSCAFVSMGPLRGTHLIAAIDHCGASLACSGGTCQRFCGRTAGTCTVGSCRNVNAFLRFHDRPLGICAAGVTPAGCDFVHQTGCRLGEWCGASFGLADPDYTLCGSLIGGSVPLGSACNPYTAACRFPPGICAPAHTPDGGLGVTDFRCHAVCDPRPPASLDGGAPGPGCPPAAPSCVTVAASLEPTPLGLCY